MRQYALRNIGEDKRKKEFFFRESRGKDRELVLVNSNGMKIKYSLLILFWLAFLAATGQSFNSIKIIIIIIIMIIAGAQNQRLRPQFN